MPGLAEGSGFGTGVAILRPPPHRNLNHISLPWKLAPARVPRVNFHQVGTARRRSRLLKKAISWQQSRFRNGCEEFPFETKDKQKRTQTGRSMSPLLDGRTERGAAFPPHLCLELMPGGEGGGGVADAVLIRLFYIFIRTKMDNA